MSEAQLKIKELREELLNLKLRKTTGQMEKPHLIREQRRNIARLETVVNQKIETDVI